MATGDHNRLINSANQVSLFGNVLFPKLTAVWLSGLGCDVIISCQDGAVQAPSVLLSALSKKLHHVLLLSKDKRIVSKNVSCLVWKDLLLWLYTGKVEGPPEYQSQRVFTILYLCFLVDMKLLFEHVDLFMSYFVDDSGSFSEQILRSYFSELEDNVKMEYTKENEKIPKVVMFTCQGIDHFKDFLVGAFNTSTPVTCNKNFSSKLTNGMSKTNRIGEKRTETSKVASISSKCRKCNDNCNAKTVMCLFCNDTTQRSLDHMVKEHHNCTSAKVWLYTCEVEKETVPGDFKLIAKYLPLEDAKIFKCQICSEVCNQKEKLHVHFKQVHKITSVFFCKYCFAGFKKSTVRDHHQYLCAGGVNIKCKSCNFYGSFIELKNHSCDKRGSNYQTFKYFYEKEETEADVARHCICFECDENCVAKKVTCALCFKVVSNNLQHVEEDHPFTPKASNWFYTCKVSNQNQPTHNKFSWKKVMVDNNSIYFLCERCDYASNNVNEIFDHVKQMHKTQAKVCKVCENGLTGFVAHKDHEHFCGGGSLIYCKNCDVRVNTYKNLVDHLQNVHPEKCNAFNNSQLSAKEIKKIDESKINCINCKGECLADQVQCVYCLSVIENNPSHMNEFHPLTSVNAIWMYNCHFKDNTDDSIVCVKEEIDQSSTTSTKEYQFRCVKCNTVFITKLGIKTHIEEKHKVQVFMCKTCDFGLCNYSEFKDHEHYCSGGRCLKCSLCGCLVGSYQNYTKHLLEIHPSSGTCNVIVSDLKANGNKEILTLVTDVSERNGFCFNCGPICQSLSVKCMLCFKWVENSPKHMDTDHLFTPKTSMWAYNCKKNGEENGNGLVVLSTLETGVLDDRINSIAENGNEEKFGEQILYYRCKVCNEMLEDSQSILTHLKEAHSVQVKDTQQCEICQSVFKDMSFWKDHFHFCRGGGILKCEICDENVGNYAGLDNHNCSSLPLFSFEDNSQFKDASPKQQSLISGNLPNDMVEVKTQQKNVKRAKRCMNCGDHCLSTQVKCLYCYDILQGADISTHTTKYHDNMPLDIIWPVECTQATNSIFKEFSPNVSYTMYRGNQLVNCCIICENKFEKQTELYKHCKDNHKILLHFCKNCKAGFVNEVDLDNHQYFCFGCDLIKCKICNIFIGSLATAKAHFKEVHGKNIEYLSLKRKMTDNNDQEVKKMKESKPVNKKISNENSDNAAVSSISEIPKGIKLKCPSCEYKTDAILELSVHCIEKHSYKESELNQICSFCFLVYKTKVEREKHEYTVHLNGQRVFCDLCQRDFEIPSQKEIHVKYYHKA